MAKVQGPLFSMEASGTYGNAVTFGKWKGRPYARIRVDPSNPHASGQETARNRMRCLGMIQSHTNTTTEVLDGETLADKARIAAITPSGYAWNGYLVEQAIGPAGATYTAALAAYSALQAGEKSAWVTAAGNRTPAITECPQTTTGGGSTTALTAGQVYFVLMYALAQMGLATTPGATPPTYA